MSSNETTAEVANGRWSVAVEIGLIFLLFFLFAGSPPPDVNEAHYLAKAKHYWQPEWCAGDYFLESGDVHLVFYWTFGWLTLFFSMPAVAWIGRIVTWGLLAWSWRRLSYAVVPRHLAAVLTACLLLLFTQHFHMAGEWVVGGIEAKGIAFVFVFLALEAMLRGRWTSVWILLGLASSFHVLVGGWSMIAAGGAWISCGRLRPPLKRMLQAMSLGLLLALPGLVPALLLGYGTSADVVREANQIYVFGRLPHHLVFHRFPHEYMVRHALLLALWLAVTCATPCRIASGDLGQRPLRGFVVGAVALAIVGILIDQLFVLGVIINQSLHAHLQGIAASVLKYYWYRLSDAMLPAGTALALVAFIRSLESRRPVMAQWALMLAILVAGANLAYTNYQRRDDFRPRADVQMLPTWEDDAQQTRRTCEDWRCVCRWIRLNTDTSAKFLTPRAQQTFKWYAQRSEVCSWKDVPQNAAGIAEWWRIQHEIYPRQVIRNGLAMHGEDRLVELARKYDANYIVIDRHSSPRALVLPCVYPTSFDEPNRSYEVYRVPRDGIGEWPSAEP